MKKIETAEMLKINTMPYACYVIQERALPHINDGLKPSQRRILYTMYRYNTLWNKPRIKCYNIEGKCMELHPHGGTYQAIARLSREDSMNIPLLDPKGTMGIHNSDEINESAARYTEARLSTVSQEFFKNINKESVPMIDNYDGSIKEPKYLPVTFPSILCNVTLGIAVGFSSSICPYSFKDVCENTIKYLKGEDLDVMIPDFGTGGFIINDTDTFNKIHNTGLGTIRQRGRYRIEDNSIVFYELPYMSTVEKITDQIVEGVKKGTLKEVLDANNYTGEAGLNLTIDIKKNTNIESLLEKLYKLTDLENTFSCNFTVINDERPIVMGVKDIISSWCNFRRKTLLNITKYEIRELEKEIHLLEGLENIVNRLDEAIKIIRESNTDNDTIKDLINKLGLTKVQAEYISNKSIKTLNKSNVKKIISQLGTLRKKLKGFNDVLNSEKKLTSIIITQLEKLISDYPYQRKSELIDVNISKSNVEELLIEDYNCVYYFTKDNYMKKVRLTANKGNNKLKDGDKIKQVIETTNVNSELLVFGSDLCCHKFKTSDIEDGKLSNLGIYLPNIIDCDVLGTSVLDENNKYICVIYKNNKIAKIDIESFRTKQMRSKLANSLHNDEVFDILTFTDDNVKLKLTVDDGREKIIDLSEINCKSSRNTQGIQAITWKKQNIKQIEII